MQDTIRNIVLFGLSSMEILVCYYFILSITMPLVEIKRRDTFIVIFTTLFASYILMTNRTIAFFSQVLFAIVVIYLSSLITILVRRNIWLNIILVIIYNELLALLDFFFAFIGIEFIGTEFTEKIFLYSNSWQKIAIYMISRLIITCLILIICKKKVCIEEYKRVLAIVVVTLFFVLKYYQYNMVRMLIGEQPLSGGRMGMTLVFALICIAILSILWMKNLMIKKENDFLSAREELLLEYYLNVEKEIENNRIIVHDIKHDLLLLAEYVKNNDLKSLEKYLEIININLKSDGIEIWTQKKVWDVIINHKKQEAEQKGITVNINSMLIAQYPFNEKEGCSIFGNLLDNAIEACEKIKDGEKIINVEIEKSNQILYIKVENTLDLDLYKGVTKTSKKECGIHGYGMRSINRIVNKYEGAVAYHIKDNYFIIKLSFFDIENEEKENAYDGKKV